MGICIEKLSHSCGTSKGLQVFQDEEGNYNGYCFSCGTPIDDPYDGGRPPAVKEYNKEQVLHDIQQYALYPRVDIPSRGLKQRYLSYFGVRCEVSEQDGVTPTVALFPFGDEEGLSSWKARSLSEKKHQFIVGIPGAFKESYLFGWKRAISSGQKTLYITEGEFDAVALFQILKEGNKKEEYADVNPAVVSLKSGASSAKKDIVRFLPDIKKYFKEVVLVFDMDTPGQEAAQEVNKAVSGISVHLAALPCKDPNECLQKGASRACRNAVLFQATAPKTNRLVRGASLRELARQESKMGLSWPFHKLTKDTRGIRRGETIYFGAGVKMGKSELVNALAKHIIVDHDLPAFLIKPEEDLSISYKMLLGKTVGKIFHDPNVEFDFEAYDEAADIVGDKAIFEDIYQFADWSNLKDDVRYSVVADGVKDIFIDPITCFTNQMGSAEANEFLTSMTAELSAMAKDLDFTAYIFCHLKAPDYGPPHERGGDVLSTQFAGSRAMMRSCNYMIGLQGNKDPALPLEQRNLRDLIILEARGFGASERTELYWDHRTGLFNEVH